MPSPAYTEKEGLYSNLEGRVQECRKASYPTGEALEDWKIFNLISNKIYGTKLFDSHLSIRKSTLKEIKNFSEIDLLPMKEITKSSNALDNFTEEQVSVNNIDYYFSNSIARASKTMSDCRNIGLKNKKNGTNN